MSGDGDREAFFHCLDRVPSGLHLDADFPSDEDDDDEDDVRVSFASAMGDVQRLQSFRGYQVAALEEEEEDVVEAEDPSVYRMWMSDDHMSIQERRRRLHQGLGMASSRDLALQRHSMKKRPVDVPRGVSRRLQPPSPLPAAATASAEALPTSAAATTPAPVVAAAALQAARAITRSHSEGSLAVRARDGGASAAAGSRKVPPSSQPLRRVRSLPARHAACDGAPVDKAQAVTAAARGPPVVPLPAVSSVDKSCGGEEGDDDKSQSSGGGVGKDVVVASKDDASLSNAQSGVLGLEEIEKFIGNTPIMKHLVRRGPSQHHHAPAPPPKAEKPAGKKKGAGWLKNIKSVAIGFIHDKQDTGNAKSSTASTTTTVAPKSATANASAAGAPGASSSERLKVHQSGKSSKELTGLYMCQEIPAHEGSIWSIKFSTDGRRLASAGEDHVVRVWRVVETSAPPSFLPQLDGSQPATDGGGAPAPALAQLSKKSVNKAGKSGRDATTLPEHLVVPDKMFALAERPACVLEGHSDDVLDLTWSNKSDQLLSSSMDKTVRLWDTERQVCLKTFTHNDYVTCIHFNPVDDRYFISGSLDAKVRLWSIPNRQVVDWTDLNEMVTAASYTPDGQGAIVGSHKGSCRLYKTTDCKLTQEAQIDIQAKKRSKSQEKKITGFQFASSNPSEVLVTSADSQIRVFDGVTMVQKFRGYKNTSSQIAASYTADGRYAVCASEDSHVYLWRTARAAPAPAALGIGMKPKAWCTVRSYENFFCKDVSAAVPWPHAPSPAPPGDTPSSSRDKQQQQQGVSCNEDSCSVAGHAAAAKPSDGGRSGELSGSGGAPLTHSGELSRPGAGKTDGGNGNAWGLVVVAATLGGEIRVYQNFGMPFRIRGQGNLFY